MKIIRKNKIAIATTLLFFSLNVFCQSTYKFVIILDAGHGGKDPGNCNHSFVEKNIALKTTLNLEKYLSKDKDIKVVYTRKSDVFIKLKDRPKVANSIHANLFVSIHCNSAKNKESYGTETFVMGLARSNTNLEIAKNENSVILFEKDYKEVYKGFDPKKPETLIGLKIMQEEYLNRSVDLASKIENNFKNKLNRKSRGIKQTPLWVLDAAYMPSVLVELGFLSNEKEGQYLNTEAGQSNMAEAIADAIIAYKKEYFGIDKKNSSKNIVEKDKSEPSTKNNKAHKQDLKTDTSGVVFKVQITAGNKNIKLKPKNFKGLDNVSVTTDNGALYKYVYGSTSDYKIAKQNLEVAKSKGFTSAYLIAYKDGEKISIQEAIKL